MPASMRNLELKARDPDPPASLERALALGAADEGEIDQRDTYFSRARGRLKLREQQPGGAELIAYRRGDEPGARESHYRLRGRGGARGPWARRSTPPWARWSW